MSVTLKRVLKSNAQSRIYKKENERTLIDFRDTIIHDLNNMLLDAKAVKQSADKVISEGVHSDEFVMKKIEGELECLSNCIKQLTQLNESTPKDCRLADIYKSYKRIMKTQRCIRNIKEYIHRIREDNLMYIINKNSQQS